MTSPDTLRAALAELQIAVEYAAQWDRNAHSEMSWRLLCAAHAVLTAPAASAAELREAANEASDYLAELYAKYQRKVGPFASQGQRINVRLRAAINAAPQPDSAPAAPVAEALEDGMPASSEERQLRRMLCASHSPLAYMDDGEASDCTASPFIDFMRDSVAVISKKLRARAVSKLAAAGSAEPASSGGAVPDDSPSLKREAEYWRQYDGLASGGAESGGAAAEPASDAQEAGPVAWMRPNGFAYTNPTISHATKMNPQGEVEFVSSYSIPLYAAPQAPAETTEQAFERGRQQGMAQEWAALNPCPSTHLER